VGGLAAADPPTPTHPKSPIPNPHIGKYNYMIIIKMIKIFK
jgi:hypothetical protein